MIPTLYEKFQPWSRTGSIYIISDTHFEDEFCKDRDLNWISPEEQIGILKKVLTKQDSLIHLGDVGNPDYLDELKCYKILITGNHDKKGEMKNHFQEMYDGPLFISDKLLLSHEPIYGLEKFCFNIHGHNHSGTHFTYNTTLNYFTHLNMAANVSEYQPVNLGKFIKAGYLNKMSNYHRLTIDNALDKKGDFKNDPHKRTN